VNSSEGMSTQLTCSSPRPLRFRRVVALAMCRSGEHRSLTQHDVRRRPDMGPMIMVQHPAVAVT